jgi:hypothetical protein
MDEGPDRTVPGLPRGSGGSVVARHIGMGRSRRPKTSPRATPVETVALALALRQQLTEQGLDAGADRIGWHCNTTKGDGLAGDDPPDPHPAANPRRQDSWA